MQINPKTALLSAMAFILNLHALNQDSNWFLLAISDHRNTDVSLAIAMDVCHLNAQEVLKSNPNYKEQHFLYTRSDQGSHHLDSHFATISAGQSF